MTTTPKHLDLSRAAYDATAGGWVGIPDPEPEAPGMEFCSDRGPGSAAYEPRAAAPEPDLEAEL
jgi:hypothetical protein